MTALSVLFRQFDSSAERLRFAWESCGHMAMSISDLPSAILVHHDGLRKLTRGFAGGSVAMEPNRHRLAPAIVRSHMRCINRDTVPMNLSGNQREQQGGLESSISVGGGAYAAALAPSKG